MNEDNMKHIELIQNVINRHNSNSFRIKGWAITLVSAIFALTGTIREPSLCFIAIGPIFMFWILDSIFLANERCFVSLYNCVADGGALNVDKSKLRKRAKENLKDQDSKLFQVNNYSMNFTQFREIKRNNWWSVLFSYTIWWYYLALIVLTGFTFIGLNKFIKPETNEPIQIETTITGLGPIQINPIEMNSNIKSIDTLILKLIGNKQNNPTKKTK